MNKTEIKAIERTFIKKLQEKFADENTNRIYIKGLGVFNVRNRKVVPNKINGWKEPKDFN
jgi:nucleoid DNA-binding protein